MWLVTFQQNSKKEEVIDYYYFCTVFVNLVSLMTLKNKKCIACGFS